MAISPPCFFSAATGSRGSQTPSLHRPPPAPPSSSALVPCSQIRLHDLVMAGVSLVQVRVTRSLLLAMLPCDTNSTCIAPWVRALTVAACPWCRCEEEDAVTHTQTHVHTRSHTRAHTHAHAHTRTHPCALETPHTHTPTHTCARAHTHTHRSAWRVSRRPASAARSRCGARARAHKNARARVRTRMHARTGAHTTRRAHT